MSASPVQGASSGRVISSAASATSVMGTDEISAPSSLQDVTERTGLMDVERGVEYGSRTSSLTMLLPHLTIVKIAAGKGVPQKQTSTFEKRVKYYIPSLVWIPNYNASLYVVFCELLNEPLTPWFEDLQAMS